MENGYDVIIVGGGPAGLTAALYLARAKYRVLVLEKLQFGGQIALTEEVVNYPGLERIGGMELAETMRHQAEGFGAEFQMAEVTGFLSEEDRKVVRTTRGDFSCLGILLATGAQPRTVGFQGEEAYKGRGVSYCATCDGAFFNGKDVFVIGGGYAAAEESVFLTKFARHVTVLIRREDFSCAASVAEQVRNHEKITVLTNTVMEEVSGDGGLNYARYRNTKTGEITHYRSREGERFGVFVFAGYAPDTGFLKDAVALNEQGYIVTDASGKTSVDGVYAAGDVCVKPLRQIVTATADGALAAVELEKYVAAIHQKRGGAERMSPAKKEGKPEASQSPEISHSAARFFTEEMLQQLDQVFSRMEHKLILELSVDDRPVSGELETFLTALADLSDRLILHVADPAAAVDDAPCVRICTEEGSWTGLAFHGVPGGHEFTSFILGLYNAAGPGQRLDASAEARIASIDFPVDMKVLVTLSCTMCPDTVIAAQQIAARNPHVMAQVYDVQHFAHLREAYQVMSVPCLVVNDQAISFGKKNIHQILDLILKADR